MESVGECFEIPNNQVDFDETANLIRVPQSTATKHDLRQSRGSSRLWEVLLMSPRTIPELRPQALVSEQPENSPNIIEVQGQTPGCPKILVKDVEHVSKALEAAARQIRRDHARNPDSLFIRFRCFLDPMPKKEITRDFHLIMSKEILEARVNC
jgi:hypothetical protein